MSPIIVFVGLSNLFGMQILIPTNQQNKFTISVSVGALVSIIINLLLVNTFGSRGTAFATLLAELVVAVIMLVYVKGYINHQTILKLLLKYGALSVLMGILVFVIGFYSQFPAPVTNIIQIIFGFLFYFTILYLIRDQFLLQAINKVLKKRWK
nr:polysaccharide biosynthesis C-terminal domain-containing protein [Cohnella algarum]